ncbi:hypothetical protein [Streptomyces sp. GS7]|uniref:hypothetical protein n=1 Tax=Streptomyces sp. GS7 TaxID=2692234 RepID=UPI001319A2FE|nr:hypothetical protein [Streptomyces sp. GS7]QHC24311.1 hypothetical protein GR130_25955 [Streptomyces sp. GS7]
MKISKAAASVAGVALALGAASPALAAPAASGNDKPLLDSNTVSKSTVTKPGDIVDIKAIVNGVDKVAKSLATKNDLASKTNALGGAATR